MVLDFDHSCSYVFDLIIVSLSREYQIHFQQLRHYGGIVPVLHELLFAHKLHYQSEDAVHSRAELLDPENSLDARLVLLAVNKLVL